MAIAVASGITARVNAADSGHKPAEITTFYSPTQEKGKYYVDRQTRKRCREKAR